MKGKKINLKTGRGTALINHPADAEIHDPELFGEEMLKLSSSRRNFLKVFGFSFASAAVVAACKRPVIKAIPYVDQPPEVTPGNALYYATTFYDGHEYCSIVAKTRDGRPIKLEGNLNSPFNGEGTTARVQASILGLYDDARLKNPETGGKAAGWTETDDQIIKELSGISSEGGEIAFLSSPVISPSTSQLINKFGSAFKNFRWVQYEPVSYSAIREANRLCFGRAVVPDYNFDKASLVVSIGADFLGTWIAPVHFIPKYVLRRKLSKGQDDMLRHVQLESGMSLTGANADERIKIRPSEELSLLSSLYNNIASLKGAEAGSETSFRIDLAGLAEELVSTAGKSIVISGTNNLEIQLYVNRINNLLGNYGECIDLINNINTGFAEDSRMENLVKDMNSGKIAALFMYNVNPVYDYCRSGDFLSGMKKVRLSVNMATAINESTGVAKFECPVNHYLESWDDAEIVPGQLSLQQPCISPIFNTRQMQDSLLKWSGETMSWHDYLMAQWEKEHFPRAGMTGFRNFWNSTLQKGILSYGAAAASQPSFNQNAPKPDSGNRKNNDGGFEIILNESIALGTGMHANNPWLMELPDPVSRHCWQNVASISPADAGRLGVITDDVIRIQDGLVLTALVQPGQAEGTISVATGYGHDKSGPVAEGKGVNVFPFAEMKDGNRSYVFASTGISKTGETDKLALVQIHSSMEERPIVRQTLLSKYRENPTSGNEIHEEFESKHKSLYPDWSYDGFHWALAIDLNACIGCHTCVIACQAENNSPTVGKDDVRRNRIMQWIKVHRYYDGEPENPKVLFQPVFCQHCDNAPCENVCPVSATNHSNEGINQMAYNRCVGTKYCMNNCPYRVRRFNWFRYTNSKVFPYNSSSDLGKMVLNPDVTVRERGVVEKCSFCVQRIQAKKLEAKIQNRVPEDLEIKTACMQACPAGAIVFGNLNDRESRVAKLFSDPRRYHLLEELHTLPSVGFLTKVWNDGRKV